MTRTIFHPLALILVGSVFFAAVGCGKQAIDPGEEAGCSSDADCDADQRCEPVAGPDRRPTVALPCMITFQACMTSADCTGGQVCWPLGRTPATLPFNCFASSPVCGAPCSTAPNACYADEICETNGECRLPRCDEEGAMACASHWRCDPAAAAMELLQPVYGANELDSPTYSRDIQRGCARLRCDEPDGFTCKEGWVCAPDEASDPSGCVPLPCAELGHCSEDSRYICEPTSSRSRYGGTDPHGCVVRNCEEGLACTRLIDGVDVGYCDYDGPSADVSGCASKPCDAPGSVCYASQICEPSSVHADSRGCRVSTCVEGFDCGTFPCDPEDPNAEAHGCVIPPPPATGGTGGGGASGGQAGAAAGGAGGSGGTSSGGSTGASGGNGGNGGNGGSSAGASGGNAGTGGTGGSAPEGGPGRCIDR